MTGFTSEGLKEGQNYRVLFKMSRAPKEMVGTYMGTGLGGLHFNLRPKGGTAVITEESIIEMWETSARRRLPAKPLNAQCEVRVF